MALSVGIGRIVNDPDATIRTRKALGRLATPGLLVNDKGITIDSNGRIVLRLAPGLSESLLGLSINVAPNGGLVAGLDGLALANPIDTFTVNTLTVNQNASVGGALSVVGAVTAATGVIGDNQFTALGLISGAIEADSLYSLNTLYVTGNSVLASDVTIGGDLTVLGTINGSGGGGGGGDITPTSVRINGGTTILRCLSYFVTLSLGLGGGSPDTPQDFTISLPGADASDQVICSPLASPGANIESWSAAMIGTGTALIRIGKSEILGSTASITFRVTVIGFA